MEIFEKKNVKIDKKNWKIDEKSWKIDEKIDEKIVEKS